MEDSQAPGSVNKRDLRPENNCGDLTEREVAREIMAAVPVPEEEAERLTLRRFEEKLAGRIRMLRALRAFDERHP